MKLAIRGTISQHNTKLGQMDACDWSDTLVASSLTGRFFRLDLSAPAVAARERKKASKDAQNERKEREIEDAKWQDNDKQLVKKQQRKEADERKRQEQLLRKAEAKAILQKEMDLLKGSKPPPPPAKITRAEIQAKRETEVKKKPVDVVPASTHLEIPLEENLNRLQIEGEDARGIDEAIKVLGGDLGDYDKHPEKRMKAAYTAYEDRRLRELKIEFPTLRLSQLKQIIFKEWQKSPENPLNKS